MKLKPNGRLARTNSPDTRRQEELSPEQMPHESIFLPDPRTPSHPTFCQSKKTIFRFSLKPALIKRINRAMKDDKAITRPIYGIVARRTTSALQFSFVNEYSRLSFDPQVIPYDFNFRGVTIQSGKSLRREYCVILRFVFHSTHHATSTRADVAGLFSGCGLVVTARRSVDHALVERRVESKSCGAAIQRTRFGTQIEKMVDIQNRSLDN